MSKQLTVEVDYGTEYTLSSQSELSTLEGEFKRDGYTLSCWNTKADGTGTEYPLESELTATEDIDLYAIWQQQSHEITGGTWQMALTCDFWSGTFQINQNLTCVNENTWKFTTGAYEIYTLEKDKTNNRWKLEVYYDDSNDKIEDTVYIPSTTFDETYLSGEGIHETGAYWVNSAKLTWIAS